MSSSNRIITWFRDDPLPSVIDDPAIVVGGTSILKEFLSVTSEDRIGGRLTIAVPFIGDGVLATASFWEFMNHPEIELRMVVRGQKDAAEAWQQISPFPWRSVQIGCLPRLHAKMYVFEKIGGGGAAMIGSHNLSYLGACGNQEAGVLIVSRRPGPAAVVISDLHDRVMSLLADSTAAVDTTAWPELILTSERVLT